MNPGSDHFGLWWVLTNEPCDLGATDESHSKYLNDPDLGAQGLDQGPEVVHAPEMGSLISCCWLRGNRRALLREVVDIPMTKISIYRSKSAPEDLKKLADLAHAAGHDPNSNEIVDQIGEPSENCEDEVILVLATSDNCKDPGFETALSRVPNGGRRAVCVWQEGAQEFELPTAAKNFAYSIVPWNPERLRVVLADDDIVCFESPTGAPLPKVPTERNLCVEETGKPK